MPFDTYSTEFRHFLDNLIKIGNGIDLFLDTKNDYLQFQYLLDVLSDDRVYNSYYMFKLISIIEMLIKNTKGTLSRELTNKLPEFIPNRFKKSEKLQIARTLAFMRNQIAHGNFQALSTSLEAYATVFMKNYYFDYYEYSRENWIYLNFCCLLNEVVASLLYRFINDKTYINKLKIT